jgi:uncharacterized protein
MTLSEILAKLNEYKKQQQREYMIMKIGVFGSVAKGTSGEKSDIDIVVEQREPDLFLLGCIKTDLEEEFGKKVDIVRFRKEMNPFLKSRIEQEVIYV